MALGCCEISLWRLLLTVAVGSPLQGIREIYGNIYGLFLWGYSLKPSHETEPDNKRMYRMFTEELIQSLEADDIDLCAALMKQFVSEQFIFAERYLIRHGFRRDELRLSSSISFLLSVNEE